MSYQTKGLIEGSNFASGTVRHGCFLRPPAEGEGEVTLGPALNMSQCKGQIYLAKNVSKNVYENISKIK